MTTHSKASSGLRRAMPEAHSAGQATRRASVLVVGATPGGIACALRVAREGVRVLLVEESQHLGGMWTSGLQGFDTRYSGHRCPILSEFLARLQQHYRQTFGDGSPEHAMACFGDPRRHGERPRFEASVAEQVFLEMVREQEGLSVLHGHRLVRVAKEGRSLRKVGFERLDAPGEGVWWADADIFVDATYEADLAARAGAPCRVGRESRSEYGEPHAGRHFTTIEPIGDIGREIAERLNLHYFNRTSRRVDTASTGEGDSAVQAYTLRLTLTDRPENRRPIPRPVGYDRASFLGMFDRSPDAHAKGYPLSSHYLCGEPFHFRLAPTLPNGKTDWIGANFVGRNHDYPEAGPELRRKLYEEHVAHALGTLHFLQTDPAVPESIRNEHMRWGLARDEFVDTGNIPWMMYVREARRLRGRYIFTEHDATRHPRHQRSPINSDAIAFAEWPMDSHDCNAVRVPGSFNDGEMILAEQTLPSQIPFRCLLSESVENLLVPVCLSSTHIGWGTLRLEPVFVHTGEAAGVAAALCLRDSVLPHQLDSALLQQELLRRRVAVTYFSDVDAGDHGDATAALQLLGARGFFGTYAAEPDSVLSPVVASRWQAILRCWREGVATPDECAAFVLAGKGLPSTPDPDASAPLAERINGGILVRDAARRVAGCLRARIEGGLAV